MIDVLQELSNIEKEWNDKFISIYDLMFCIKGANKNIKISDIAKVLLNRLSDFNIDTLDIQEYPDIFFNNQWLLKFDNEKQAFTCIYGIPCYFMRDDYKASSLAYKDANLFFSFLYNIKNGLFSPNLAIPLDEWNIEKAYIKRDLYRKK
ncbi:Uncharacterised protein [Mannheimia haemolytica]|nr:Uncharacterised protein [Mannheimia haemolytica]